ncbi:ankyrin repeat domain-containing protein [Pseudoduganella buxea]|uniref:Ankyrin repeat domain-containing protein n=2 Tax=Pseudoduganella buxea TaxID=1949069 RepID=A0ABQ1KG00_9BURK|nr:ankyrin repeat domain-containing protein [Pseudoduganella buxea]GGB94671.1 hypothetical protein GCM10011572_15760 [Pseudoduganella buxea]
MKTIVLATALLAGGAAAATSPCAQIAKGIPFADAATGKTEATAQVQALFDAANAGDEAAFAALLAAVPNPDDYVVGNDKLLHRLLRPARSLVEDEAAWRKDIANTYDKAHFAGQQRKHAALYAAKTRMLALALQAGVSVKEAGDGGTAPLHLAALYGTAEMVKMLVAAGADVRQVTSSWPQEEALEAALRQERAGQLESIVTPAERTRVVLALVDAGAPLPGKQMDKYQACERKARKEDDKAFDRPGADYLLWDDLLALTQGREVLDRMLALGTRPYTDEGAGSLFAHAAAAGNVEGVAWLKERVPRHDKDGTDLWVEGAMWALMAPPEAADRILHELLEPAMPWQQNGPRHIDHHGRAWRHVPRNETANATLLERAILAGRSDVVRRLVKLGAPVADDDAALLARAVAAGDVAMVRTLLELGVSPLAGETPALEVAVAGKTGTDFDSKAGGPTPARRGEMLALLLAALRQRQLAVPDDSRLLDEALRYATSAERASLARMVLDAGVPARNLSFDGIQTALRSPDRALFGTLLAQGFLRTGASDETSAERREAASAVLREAILVGRADLIAPMLALQPDLGWRGEDGLGALDVAIRRGDVAVVDALLAAGATLDDPAALDHAIVSGKADMVRFIAGKSGRQVGRSCVPDGAALAELVKSADDAFWTGLRAQGFGARACPDMAPRLVAAFADSKALPYAGWLGERLRQRMADLRADHPAGASDAATATLLAAPRNETLARLLQQAGWPAQATGDDAAANDRRTPARRAADEALRKKMAGDYEMSARELVSGIRLRPDGTFSYMLIYGGVDEQMEGRWTIDEGQLRLVNKVAPVQVLYTPVADDPATPPPAGQLAVNVYYRGSNVQGMRVTVLGDQPALASGTSTRAGWQAGWRGPVRQIVLAHDEAGDGRPFVFEVPPAQANQPSFAFTLPEQVPGRSFDARLAVRGDTLVWPRAEGEFSYRRVASQGKRPSQSHRKTKGNQ